MKHFAFLVVFLGLALMVSANARSPLEILQTAQPLSRNMSPPQEPRSFSWSNCGASTDPTVLLALQISPDPIVLGANVSIAAKVHLSEDVTATSGHTVSLEIYKKFFGAWIYVPCVDGVGSCTLSNICEKIHTGDDCPLAPWGVPCSCPFNAGTYTITPPGLNVHIKNPNLSWLTDGDIKVQATLNNASGNRLACYQIVASVTTA